MTVRDHPVYKQNYGDAVCLLQDSIFAVYRLMIDGKLEEFFMNKRKIKKLTTSAMIATVYLVLTLIFYVTSFAPMQSRLAEALTILPYFTPLAIPGLFVGCILSNIIGGYGIWDVVVGSLATLLSAYLTYKLTYNKPKRKWIAPIPPILINAVFVGVELSLLAQAPLFATMLSVGVGQIIACYILGYPLMIIIEKNKKMGELFNLIS